MTNSLYQNIQALGNRMVSNLTAKGVSAQFSDGGLTLADKILDINQFNDGVFLASDKKIGQSSNTVHLSAMVVDDGMFKVGEPVIIEDKVNTTPIYTKTKNNENPLAPDELNDSIGSGRWALVFGTYSGSGTAPKVYFKNVDDEWFSVTKTSTGFTIDSNLIPESGSGWIGGDLTGTILYYCDGRIFTDTGDSISQFYGGYGHRDYDTVQYLEGTISLYKIYGGGITDDSGAVPGIYTCSGAGLKEIVAKSGSVVSQPTTVYDCVFYDTGIDGTANSNWSGALTRTPSSNGTLITASSTWQNLYVVSDSTFFSNPFCIELEVVSFEDTPTLRFRKKNEVTTSATFTFNSTGKYKFEFKSDSIKVYKNGTEVQHWLSPLVGVDLSVAFECSATTDKITYKDFKVYPI